MTYNSKFNYMKKILLSIAAVFLTLGAMAQNTIDLTFNRNNNAAGTDATVSVASTGDVNATGITSTIACNYNWKAFGANSETFPNSSILCPDKNTNAMTAGNEGVITLTLSNVPQNYSFKNITFTSVALNGGGSFQGDNANAQQVNFTLTKGESTLGIVENVAIKVNSSPNDYLGTKNQSVTVPFEIAEAYTATNGTLELKLKLSITDPKGCFYGLIKVSIDTEVATPELPEEPAEVSYLTQVTASDLMAKTEPTYIAIKNLSYTNNRWFVGNTGAVPYSAEELTENAIFIWEPVQAGVAGSYYLKKGDTYMQTSSPKDFGTIENAAVFTATAPGVDGTFNGDGDSNLYITGSNDANLVRFVKGSNWINVQNGANGTPVYNTGTGGWTIHYVYEIAEVASFKANISGVGYATFYAPVEVAIPENVKAYYIAAVSSESATLTQIENVIPANTAVILEGAEGEYTFSVSETDAAAVSGNLLKGTVINTNIIGQAYVLGFVEGEVGLYKTQMSTVQLSSASGSVSVFKNNAYKAYLPASAVPATANNVASFSFRFGEGTTGVEEMKTEPTVDASQNGNVKTVYDLTGRRVEEITAPGIYIVNGKKVLVK